MNIQDLREAQARYENRLKDIEKERKYLYQLRSKFVTYFNPKRIMAMSIDEYVIGAELPQKGYNFCYTLERELDGLGRILGATAFKFGVYYGRTTSDAKYKYRFAKKFGSSYKTAFECVKEAILQLIEFGKSEDISAVTDNILSPMFKGKILSTYFPDRYLNVFSKKHLNHFLTQLDIDNEILIDSDPIYTREALLKYKNQDQVMKKWSIDLFAHFLYAEYPGKPKEQNQDGTKKSRLLSDYQPPNFPSKQTASYVNPSILPPRKSNSNSMAKDKGDRGKADYEKNARISKKLGDRGEKIVMDLERKRLISAGREDLSIMVKRVSLKSDSLGYDILSFEEDGRERRIEVKATRSKVGITNFFYTINELETASSAENYYIYIVYEVTSNSPKVWPLKNPFYPKNDQLLMSPIKYRVTINSSS